MSGYDTFPRSLPVSCSTRIKGEIRATLQTISTDPLWWWEGNV